MITNKVLVGAVVCTIALFILVVCIFCYLVVQRRMAQRFQQKVDRYIQKYEKSWYDYLLQGQAVDDGIKAVGFPDYVREAVDKIFITYVTVISNVEVKRNISRYAALNLKKHYIKMLRSKEWATRLNVLRRIILFDLDFLVPTIETNLKSNQIKTKEEYVVVLEIIAKYNRNLFLAHMYVPRMKLSEYEYKVLLAHIDAQYMTDFVADFDQLPIHLQLSVVDYLSLNSSVEKEALYFLESLLQSIHLEIRIRALKAIRSFGIVTSIDKYRQFLMSYEWEERLMLAKVLCLMDGQETVPMLEQLIRDKYWNVRRQAALTLKDMKNGRTHLEAIVRNNEDRFAVEMAREVLEGR